MFIQAQGISVCRSTEFKPNAAGWCCPQLRGPAVPPRPAQPCSRRCGLPDVRGLLWDWVQEPWSGRCSAGRAHYFTYELRVLAFLLPKNIA